MKRLFAVLLTTALLVSLVPMATAQEPVTLTMWSADIIEGHPIYELVAEYEELNPGITIELRSIPFPEYDNTCLAALEANQGPDLMAVNSVTMGAFVQRGYLMPINDFLASPEATIKPEDFFESIWSSHVVFSDQVFGLPVDTGTRLLFWNKAMFEEVGVEPPTRWDEVIDVAKQLTDPDKGTYGFVATAGERWVWLYEHMGMHSIANGLAFVNPEGTECVFDQDSNWETLQFWMDMANAGVLSVDDLMAAAQDARYTSFGNNRAAMFLGGHWAREVLESDYGMEWPDDYGLILLEGDAGIGSSTGGWNWSITKDAQHAEEAFAFLQWAVGVPENLIRLTNIMPVTTAANPMALTDEFYDPFKEVLATNAYHPIPLNPGLPEQAEILRNISQAAMLGQMTAEEAATAFCEQIAGTLFEVDE